MRVVLDTNILARAAGSRGGPAGELFERICGGQVLVVSPELLAELARVLNYDRVRRMHRLSDAETE
jgi:predicted nucleic acid-binding protein